MLNKTKGMPTILNKNQVPILHAVTSLFYTVASGCGDDLSWFICFCSVLSRIVTTSQEKRSCPLVRSFSYSRISVARTPLARLPWLIRTCFWDPTEFFR